MTHMAAHRLGAGATALAVVLSLAGVANAQETPNAIGLIIGEVARCVDGAEQPAAEVSVGVQGGGSSLGRTDSGGQFFLSLPAGQYTVVATASDGTASRQYVPVEAGQALDIGVLDLGGGIAGCGPDSTITAPILPTFTPSATPAPANATPTLAPTVAPTSAAAAPTPAPDTEPTPQPEG